MSRGMCGLARSSTEPPWHRQMWQHAVLCTNQNRPLHAAAQSRPPHMPRDKQAPGEQAPHADAHFLGMHASLIPRLC